ncbi:F-box protein At1g47056-like [Diospyros lotus]|uniref:F-box protein At1g47056-like n=1 Tax=Diospyros lotus TaxID=55363 RepID=UPI00224EC512|nr:F-box protein At1g47056-like [Diospyros lotus]
MGQSASSYWLPSGSSRGPARSGNHRAAVRSEVVSLMPTEDGCEEVHEGVMSCEDYISELPDLCLAWIFQSLSSGDRKSCSLVCKRWLRVEGQSRHRLALDARSELLSIVPSLFSRFDAVTKLALRCDRRSISIDDDTLILISFRCSNLTRLKLRGCRQLTDVGLAALAKNCKGLKKLSCGSCVFWVKGMNALLDHCSNLEEISVKRLRGIHDGGATDELVGPGIACSSLKTICLKELYNGQCFAPLIIGAKNLRTLKLLRCLGDWDRLLETIANRENSLVEIHLERLQVSDSGLKAVSNCSNLEILHIVKTPDCTNVGIVSIAEHCKKLRKLHIDGWRTNRIGNEGLIAIAKHCANLQELVLIGVNPSSISLEPLASNCQKLERLALCGSETIGDEEISCIAAKCVALKKLCIKGCPVSDRGIETFAWGCPNLEKIKVKKCSRVTSNLADRLGVRRKSLVVNLDVCEVGAEVFDTSGSDGGPQEDGVEFPLVGSHISGGGAVDVEAPPPSSSNGRPSFFKSRFGLFGGKGLVAWTCRRNSSNNNSPNGGGGF